MSGGARPADWWCARCAFTVWGSKASCSKCGTRRPGSRAPEAVPAPIPALPTASTPVPVTVPVAVPSRSGDWTCAACGVNNFAKRRVCFKCDVPKPAQAKEGHALQAVAECAVCMGTQATTAFVPCGHVTCRACGHAVVNCPLCRGAIDQRLPLYLQLADVGPSQ